MFQLRNIVDPETREIVKNPDPSRPAPWCAVPAPASGRRSPGTTPSPRSHARSRTRATRRSSRPRSGLTVNYTPGIASLGGSQENSEEEYLILKAMRSLGIIAIDNQARV